MKPMRKASIAALVTLLVLVAAQASAHHAFAAEFDAKKPIKLQGTVTKMEWINPNAWIHINVKKTDGTVEDPKTWTRPWTAIIPWNKIDPAEQMYEYACHEDNYDIVHFLTGARAREKRGETK